MNNYASSPVARAQAGFVLYVTLIIVLAIGAVGGFFLYAAYEHSNAVRRWHASDQCLLDAQSGLERIKYELVHTYLSVPASSVGSFDWFLSWNSQAIGSNPVYTIPALDPINDSSVAVRIANVTIVSNAGYVDVDLIVAAVQSAPYVVTRAIHETLRVNAGGGGGDVQPFEYAYLLNSSGQLRNNMVVNGDIRINGNYKLNPSSIVNGSRYASGQLTANSPLWSIADYWNSVNTSPSARPTDPTGLNNIAWPMGYIADKSKNAFLPAFIIPPIDYISTLSAYTRGRITQNGQPVAINVYDGPGPDKIENTADDHCLVLDGSSSPITIQGSVAVKGDLIIRGKVGGQGTIYAGRNVHIVGDLSYVNPPTWPKPDANPLQTAVINAGKDLLVLAAKGNIVVGNYTTSTWSNRVWSIMADPTRNAYNVIASDAALGYDSDNISTNGYLFDGRYYANEVNNGRRLSGNGTNTVPRKYYESSLDNATFNALCDPNNVPSINAALLSNHGIVGNLGSSAVGGNTTLNGAMACHDEAHNFYGVFTINWDIRLGSQSKERASNYLTSGGTSGVAAVSTTIGWREIH